MQSLATETVRLWQSVRRFDAVQHMHGEWRVMLPVMGFSAGCALYIGTELILSLSTLVAGLGIAVGLFFMPRAYFIRPLVLCALALVVGLLVSDIRIRSLDYPVVKTEHFAVLEGIVTNVEIRHGKAARLTLEQVSIADWRSEPPAKIRLLVRGQFQHDIHHLRVRVPAILRPPSGAIVPGGYNFSRRAYFDGLGGEGFVAGAIEIIGPQDDTESLVDAVPAVRDAVGARLRAVLPGQAGAVATALLTGDRNFIDKDVAQNFRDAGLAHLMAISGLHMGLVAAGVFFVFEYLFALFPAIALRITPRKAAALVAWVIAFGYLLLSGAGVPTLRAFVMVSVGLLAVLLDRRVLSLRSVAIAAWAILIFRPEALLSVGFQMSFAATAALVAFFEKAGRHKLFQLHGGTLMSRIGRFMIVTLVTTLIAELAIAPFALYHFQAVPLVGLGANLLAIHLMSMVIMPALLVMLLLIAVGMEGWIAWLLDPALDGLIGIAQYFGEDHGVVAYVPHAEPLFLAVGGSMMALVLLTAGRARLRMLLLSMVIMPASFQPTSYSLLIDNGGNVVAESFNDDFHISGGRRGGFRDENWARFWGNTPDGEPQRLPRRCDSDACLVELHSGGVLAKVRSLEGMRQSCAHARVVVIPQAWRGFCRGPETIVSVEDLNQHGPAGIDFETGLVGWSKPKGNKPWQHID